MMECIVPIDHNNCRNLVDDEEIAAVLFNR